MTAKQDSHNYRKNDKRFVKIGESRYGGFKKGVQNGPQPMRKARNTGVK